MAIADLFKKKPTAPITAPEPQGTLGEVPLSQVMTMQQQGLSNSQIIQMLQRQGYQPTQIYDALAQSEAKQQIEPMPAVPGETAPKKEEQASEKTGDHPPTEALVEQIIDEKWHELQKELAKMNEWKELLTSRVDKVEQTMTDMRTDLTGLHNAIVARIGEYDKTLMDVGTEIKAMEKVFQKVLPELTGNIQELSRITKNVKGPK